MYWECICFQRLVRSSNYYFAKRFCECMKKINTLFTIFSRSWRNIFSLPQKRPSACGLGAVFETLKNISPVRNSQMVNSI